jgi:hypothetical protein
MQRVRQIAFVILFAGWMLPAFLAQTARERAARDAPALTQAELMAGFEPEPAPADRVVTIFRTIAGIWLFVALVYAGTLTVRFRRALIS